MRRRRDTQARPGGIETRLYRLRLAEWPGGTDWDRYQAWQTARDAWQAKNGPFETSGLYPEHRDADHMPEEPFDPAGI